jgi:hypothetical protein
MASARPPEILERNTHLAAALVVTGALVASGVMLRIGALHPRNLLAPAAYNLCFTTHVAVTSVLLIVLFLHAASPGGADRRLTAVVVGLGIVGSALVTASMRDGVLLLAASTALVGFRAVRPQLRSPRGAVLGFATAALVGGWIASWVGWSGLLSVMAFPVVMAVFTSEVLASPVGRSRALLGAIAIYLLSRLGVVLSGDGSPLALPELLAGMTVGVLVFRSARAEERSWIRWLRRAEALFFIEALLPNAILHVIRADVHIHDTLFGVAAFHLEAFVVVLALLRGLQAASLRVWGWIGLGLTFIGAQVFCWGALVMGRGGMPRRYVNYLELFTSLHVLTSVGAFVMAVGLVAVIAAHVTARRFEGVTSPSGAA